MKKRALILITLGLIILGFLMLFYLKNKPSQTSTQSSSKCAPWINVNIGDNKESVLNTCQYSLVKDESDTEHDVYIYSKAEYQGCDGIVKVTFFNDEVSSLQWIYINPSETLFTEASKDAVKMYGKEYDTKTQNSSTHLSWKKKLTSSAENKIFLSYSDSAFMWTIY